MKKILVFSLVLFFLGSCTTTKPLSMKPIDAKIPELEFFYWKNDSWQRVRGHGGDYFQAGEPKKFKVLVNKERGLSLRICKLLVLCKPKCFDLCLDKGI